MKIPPARTMRWFLLAWQLAPLGAVIGVLVAYCVHS